jgi:hypothetical protein
MYSVHMTETQVIVGKEPLGELLGLARQAAFALRAEDPRLADALRGVAAETELTFYAAPREHACC